MLVLFLAAFLGSSVAEQFIVGGSDAALGAWPSEGALLTATGSITCGCVFVHSNWVLTTSHCVTGSGYQFEFGMTVIGEGCRFTASSWAQHPDFGEGDGAYPNNIAVLHHSGGISCSNASPIIHFDNTSYDATNDNCYIIGWGRTCGSCPLATNLQEVNIPVIDDATCTSRWGSNYNPEFNICVWDQVNQDKGACNDAGHQLLCDDGTGMGWRLCGIASWHSSGCLTSYPSAYVRISSYGDWVCEETNGDVCW